MKSYLFRVAPMRAPGAHRPVELRADQTLEDLRARIHETLGLGRGVVHSFFLSGLSLDTSSEYRDAHWKPPRPLERAGLGRLALQRGKRFLYLAYYPGGVMLWHEVRVEEVGEGEGGFGSAARRSGEEPPPPYERVRASERDAPPIESLRIAARVRQVVDAWCDDYGQGLRPRERVLRDWEVARPLAALQS